MMRGIGLVVVVGMLGAVSAAPAPDIYTIKVKKNGPGERTLVDKQIQMTMVLNGGKKDVLTTVFTYVETILERPKGQPKATRLRRHYDKAQVTHGKETQTLPYQGKTVLIEKKDGTYHFEVGGEELTGKAAQQLNQEFIKPEQFDIDWSEILLPRKPVTINGGWKIDPKKPIADLEKTRIQVDAAKVKSTGKLLRVYKKDGHRFGVMELYMKLPFQSINAGPNKTPVEDGSGVVIKATVDGCIDGSVSTSTAKISMKMDVAFVLPNNTKFTSSVDVTGTESTKELPKKAEKKQE